MHVASSIILSDVSPSWSQCISHCSSTAIDYNTSSSYFEGFWCLVVALCSHACSIIKGAGLALCSAACLLLGCDLAHGAASRSVELQRSSPVVLPHILMLSCCDQPPRSSLQVLARFLTVRACILVCPKVQLSCVPCCQSS